MKKYFLKANAEELKFGDMIELDLTKDLPNGNVRHHHLECKFVPSLIPMLLENDIIEEKEVKGKKKKEVKDGCKSQDNTEENESLTQAMLKTSENLEHRIENLESVVLHLTNALSSMNGTKCCHNAKKPHRE